MLRERPSRPALGLRAIGTEEPKSGLREVVVEGERFLDAPIVHHDERNGIDEARRGLRPFAQAGNGTIMQFPIDDDGRDGTQLVGHPDGRRDSMPTVQEGKRLDEHVCVGAEFEAFALSASEKANGRLMP